MNSLPWWRRWWIQALISFGVAIATPVGTHALSWTLTLPQAVLVGVCAFAVAMLFQMAHSLHGIHVEQLDASQIITVRAETDKALNELQTLFREIAAKQLSGAPNLVFIEYCKRALDKVLKVARRAAQRGELEVRDHHFGTTKIVLSAFTDCSDRCYRCIWSIEAGEPLFDRWWREYMKQLVPLAQRVRRRVLIRILFVLDNLDECHRPAMKQVLSFVSAEKGIEYRLMARVDYERRMEDIGETNKSDFGLYGDHLLYKDDDDDPQKGVFTDDPKAVGDHRTMHDDAMQSSQAKSVEFDRTQGITLEQFLDSDKLEGKSGSDEGIAE